MQNYGLDKYPTIAADDTTINGMTDGGTLSNLIRDNSGNVYLVNNRVKHYIPGPSTCTAWGLACFDNTVTQTLSSDFEDSYLGTGGSLGILMHYGSTYYELENGSRLPFANATSMSTSGFSPLQALPANITNASQPLGKLIITTPGMVKFSPKVTLYYFDGSGFYAVDSMATYDGWSLSGVTFLAVPTSSYNQSDDPTIAGTLSQFYVDGSDQKYVISASKKIKLSDSQQNYWPDAVYASAPLALANRLTTINLGSFIKSDINFYHLSGSGTKDYIPSLDDYTGLGGKDSNTTRLSTSLSGMVADGPYDLANGHLLKIDSGHNIYIVYSHQLLSIPDMDIFWAYNFTAGISHFSSSSLSGSYSIIGSLGIAKTTSGYAYYPYSKHLLYLKPSMANSFGAKLSTYQTIDSNFLKSANPKLMTAFLRNSDNGAIYYASGGAIHYVSSTKSFNRYGDGGTPITSVNTAIINSFVLGKSI